MLRRAIISVRRWSKYRCVFYLAGLCIWMLFVFASVRMMLAKHAAEPNNSTEQRQTPPVVDAVPPKRQEQDGVRSPTPALHRDSSETVTDEQYRSCPCPPVAMCADADREQRCLEYLANYSNVESVRPMISNLRVGRTAKLRLRYRNPCVEAIAKLPQSLFPLEPYAEYVAFEIDRVLGFGYVPATTFTFLPIADIEAAAADFANKPRSAGKREAGGGTPLVTDPAHEYARWVSAEVLGFAMKKGLIVAHPATGKLVLGCSVQLFLRTVRPPQRTVLAEEDGYAQLLRSPALYQLATGTDAARDFTARKAMSLAGDMSQLIHAHRQRLKSVRRHFYDRDQAAHQSGDATDDDDYDESGLSADSTTRKELGEINAVVHAITSMSDRRQAALPDVLRFISDATVFDSIIGNDDRGPIKNANAYVVDPNKLPLECDFGGRRHWLTDERAAADGASVTSPARVPVVRRVLLDQGKSFYREKFPSPRLDTPLRLHSSQCVFRRSTIAALQTLRTGELYRRLQSILPPQIIAAVGEHRLLWASHRAEVIADHARQCGLTLGGEAKTAVWD